MMKREMKLEKKKELHHEYRVVRIEDNRTQKLKKKSEEKESGEKIENGR